jgi:hypothetical protein
MAQGKQSEAVTAWKKGWDALSDKLDYRRVEAKLTARAPSRPPRERPNDGGSLDSRSGPGGDGAGPAGAAPKDRLPPAPLQQIKPQIAGKQVWHASLSDKIRFPLAIASVKGKFYAADDGGHVLAWMPPPARAVARQRGR